WRHRAHLLTCASIARTAASLKRPLKYAAAASKSTQESLPKFKSNASRTAIPAPRARERRERTFPPRGVNSWPDAERIRDRGSAGGSLVHGFPSQRPNA